MQRWRIPFHLTGCTLFMHINHHRRHKLFAVHKGDVDIRRTVEHDVAPDDLGIITICIRTPAQIDRLVWRQDQAGKMRFGVPCKTKSSVLQGAIIMSTSCKA